MWFRSISGLLIAFSICQTAHACRLEGVIGPRNPSPEIQREESAFLQASLVSDPNSLKQESAQRPAKQGAGEVYDFEDLITGFRERGNMDGWGLVHYGCEVKDLPLPETSRNTEPAFADQQYDTAVQQSLDKGTNIVMAHIRRASPEYKQIVLDNVHPFTYQNWSFMHNGTVSGAFAPAVKKKIDRYRKQLGGGPQGTTDSEHVFYYFLANLYEAAGTVDSRKIPRETVQKVFAQTIQSLIKHSELAFNPLDGSVLNLQGEIQTLPVCNFVLSDGERLLAFRRGFNLFLGQKPLSNQQRLYLVSSEKTHTTDNTVQWLLLPENHILTISWDALGNPVPALQPLSRFVSRR